MLSESRFTTPAQRRFLNVLKEANKDVVTDIEIISQDYVRFGLLKKLKVCPLREKFSEAEVKEILDSIVPTKIAVELGKKQLFEVLPIGFSFSIKDVGHYRVLASLMIHGLALSIRKLPFTIPELETLGVPQHAIDMFTQAKSGLFLVTGPTGSGKTTTIAALLEHINQSRYSKIVTVENPIEYAFTNSTSTFYQIEIGTHVKSINEAVYHILRSNPEIVSIGEIRSDEEAKACISAAETGHVVITSYHVPDSVAAIERLIYEIGNSEVTRRILASSLIAILNQRLFVVDIPVSNNGDSVEGGKNIKFVYVCEFLPVSNNPIVKKKIIDMDFLGIRKIFEEPSAGMKELGVISFSDSIRIMSSKLKEFGVPANAYSRLLNEHRYYDFTGSSRG